MSRQSILQNNLLAEQLREQFAATSRQRHRVTLSGRMSLLFSRPDVLALQKWHSYLTTLGALVHLQIDQNTQQASI